MGKIYKISIISIFIIPLTVFFLMFLLTDDSEFSESENRVLQTKPEFTTYGLFNGRYTKKFETYISDQFPFRNDFVAGKTLLDKMLLKKEGNGVYFGGDGYLLQKLNIPPKANIDRGINIIISMKEKGYEVGTLLIPSSSLVYEDLLPRFTNSNNENNTLDYMASRLGKVVNYVDLRNDLIKNKDEYLYYKTDHHLTTRGSFTVYTSYINSTGKVPNSLGDYNIENASSKFLGSLYSKVIDRSLSPDSIELYHLNNSSTKYTVERDGKVYDDIYFRDRLNEKDKYKVFLNDNYPYMKVSGNPKSQEEIVIIKDSYANSIIPFLLDHYKYIHVVDPRYYNTGLDKFIESLNCKNILYIFGLESINLIK